jgi:hypothetical protein
MTHNGRQANGEGEAGKQAGFHKCEHRQERGGLQKQVGEFAGACQALLELTIVAAAGGVHTRGQMWLAAGIACIRRRAPRRAPRMAPGDCTGRQIAAAGTRGEGAGRICASNPQP